LLNSKLKNSKLNPTFLRNIINFLINRYNNSIGW